MARRASWEGFLRLSLISVPVRAYNSAAPGGGNIHFHQLHKDCGNRIRYQKVCPVHGEVDKDEIVSGFEHEKNRYVEIEPEEIAKQRAESDEAINIEAFTAPDTVDPIYLSGKTFFLAPNGPAGQKPFALLHQVMKEKKRHAIATVVLSGREEVVVIRPLDKLMMMTVLYYDHEVKSPASFEDELKDAKISDQELKLAATLVDASTTNKVDLSEREDQYTERLTQLIEAKLSGKKLEAPRGEGRREVINLMDALRRSVEEKRGGEKKPRRMARSKRPAKATKRRKSA